MILLRDKLVVDFSRQGSKPGGDVNATGLAEPSQLARISGNIDGFSSFNARIACFRLAYCMENIGQYCRLSYALDVIFKHYRRDHSLGCAVFGVHRQGLQGLQGLQGDRRFNEERYLERFAFTKAYQCFVSCVQRSWTSIYKYIYIYMFFNLICAGVGYVFVFNSRAALGSIYLRSSTYRWRSF